MFSEETADTLIATAFILLLFIGVPVLVLVIRDRFKLAGGAVTRAFGLIVFISGLAMISLLLYNLIDSSKSINDVKLIHIFWLIFPVGFMFFGWRWMRDIGPGIEEFYIDFESPELTTSIKKAKEQLPLFIEEVAKDIDRAYIKFPFSTDTDNTEHIWAYVHHYNNGQFNVSIVNDLDTQKGAFEARMSVPEKDVEDWQIIYPNGMIKGGYSYIGAIKYLKREGIRFNRTLKDQESKLIDA